VRRMEGDHRKNGIPTEVIGVPSVAPSDPNLDENDADSGPPDPALRPQYKNESRTISLVFRHESRTPAHS